ncbi:hypothetical protein Q31b_02610 [Novipirellula aureliae]|uniref:DUF4332 domain-containing protein n=1 Tax=Novipirellula aureliae TaxID=2527966 RepID=A0A5C6E8D1_9BACT|nr:DUF4332 domain-containing protein [Novipirellula aureliae]TWU45090.1 hypothetical protein Q31b_02610 [Novipirellula aureliae]
MNKPLLSILKAAHCRSTHHFFAIDALPMVQTEPGKRLTTLLLCHHDRYLAGAKDPDTRFRDFQNHVVHVENNYWGGAPRVAHAWYGRLMKYLRADRFADAAHAAGVLSHYFTDPLQPLHTAQSDREKVLHRPIEWSITKSYHSIFQHWVNDDLRVVFQLSDGEQWLGEAILHGARFANRKYQFLLDRYRLEEGVKDPPSGLDEETRDMLAELFGLAITGWARVLERAAMEAESIRMTPIPKHSLTLATLMSTIKMPTRLWMRRIESKVQKLKIQKLFEEYRQTGDVIVNLPSDIDIVHRVVKIHQSEMAWNEKRRKASEKKVEPIEPQSQEPTKSKTAVESTPAILPFVKPGLGNLADHDPIVDAPSIGPKTAARFEAIGIHTVGEFRKAIPTEVAQLLATYWITRETIEEWQSQTTLMCEVPRLRVRDAQMLCGAGCKNAVDVANSDVSELHQEILRYSATSSGRRYLRDAKPPSRAEVGKWILSLRSDTAVSPVLRSA